MKKATKGVVLGHDKYLVIGDVHGCYDELMELLDKHRGSRHVVFVGDLVDKGPRPHRCVELAKAISATVVLGNHEENHLRYAKHEEVKRLTGKKNPMKRNDDFVDTHRKLRGSSIDLLSYMETFPHYAKFTTRERIPGCRGYRSQSAVVLHGGLLPGHTPETMDPKQIVRVRNVKPDGTMATLDESKKNPDKYTFWTDLYEGDDWVVYGHAPFMRPRISNKTMGIDTACVYGNRLTAVKLPEMEMVWVEARKVYHTKDSWE